MRGLRLYYLLFFAVLMLVVKPFIGFHALAKLQQGNSSSICIKAFTKRKLEYVDGSQFDVSVMQMQLKIPILGCLLTAYRLFSDYHKIGGVRDLTYIGLLSYFLPLYLLCRSLLI